MASAVDEDTRRTVAEGRETLGAMLSAAQSHLQKVFIVAVFALMLTIWALRAFVWDRLKADLFSRMSTEIRDSTEVVAVTPFDVILLQVKIGLAVALLLAIPLLLWYSRDALRERGLWPAERVPRWKLAVIGALATVLGVVGLAYSYFLFFPLMFDFLASNAVQVGFEPTYSIVDWAEFIFLLMLSFTLAAQLPLVMSALAYADIVAYETFRDRWRYAVLGIFVFGALFSPPDPFTQVMWALPLVALYVFSLRLAKLVVVAKQSSARVSVPAVARESWNHLAGVALLVGAAVYAFLARGGIEALNRGLGAIPGAYRPGPLAPIGAATGLPGGIAAGLVAAVAALLAAGATLFYLISRRLSAADSAAADAGPAPASAGEPADIDLEALEAEGVRAAPPEAFAALSEDEALAIAQTAMDADDPGKARAVLDRFDEAEGHDAGEAGTGDGEGEAADAEDDAAAAAGEEDGGDGDAGVVTETTTGVLNAFTEEETTEEDIGGYYYDIAFILESLTSKAFRLVAVFMAVLAATFVWLYRGGIRRVKETFFARMPTELQPDVAIVTLHPVEALIFEIKFSTLLAFIAATPLLLYYGWPAMRERGWVRGDPRTFLAWGVTLVAGVVVGSVVGFLYVSPAVISWLATDALQSDMIVAYRINNFGWLVIYTTVGIGLLAEIPVTMVLFNRGGIVPYGVMRTRWRQVVLGIFAAGALFSPRGVFTMLLIAIPASFAYALGLGLLWVVTLGGRRDRAGEQRASAD